MEICQKTKHELSISGSGAVAGELCGAVWDTGAAHGAFPAKGRVTHEAPGRRAVKVLKLSTDFAKNCYLHFKVIF